MFCGCKMAGDYECLDTVKALSSQEVNKLNASQVKKALITILTAGEPSESNSDNLLQTLISNQEKNFQVMINTMKETASFHQARTDTEIFDLNKRCDTNELKINDLTNKLNQSECKVKVLETQLSKCYNEVDELETYTRRPCLVVNNLKTEPHIYD